MNMPEFKTDLTAKIQKSVIGKELKTEKALNNGSGALKNILAKSTLTAIMIEAAVEAVDGQLPEGYITIGKSICFENDCCAIEGVVLTVESKLVNIEDGKLIFEIVAYDCTREIAKGRHERHIVNYNVFIDKVNEKCSKIQNKLS